MNLQEKVGEEVQLVIKLLLSPYSSDNSKAKNLYFNVIKNIQLNHKDLDLTNLIPHLRALQNLFEEVGENYSPSISENRQNWNLLTNDDLKKEIELTQNMIANLEKEATSISQEEKPRTRRVRFEEDVEVRDLHKEEAPQHIHTNEPYMTDLDDREKMMSERKAEDKKSMSEEDAISKAKGKRENVLKTIQSKRDDLNSLTLLFKQREVVESVLTALEAGKPLTSVQMLPFEVSFSPLGTPRTPKEKLEIAEKLALIPHLGGPESGYSVSIEDAEIYTKPIDDQFDAFTKQKLEEIDAIKTKIRASHDPQEMVRLVQDYLKAGEELKERMIPHLGIKAIALEFAYLQATQANFLNSLEEDLPVKESSKLYYKIQEMRRSASIWVNYATQTPGSEVQK